MARKCLEQLLKNLDDVREGAHGEYVARCPAHDDNVPSLSVTQRNGKILLYCHAGCSYEEILDALGMESADLFSGGARRNREIVATYDYTDEQGNLLLQVVRFSGKEFRQRSPDGDGWRWSVKGVKRVLYRLPEVLAAVEAGKPVFICEGEKDADLLSAEGLTATTNAGGAGKWLSSYNEPLKGADVVILPDNDEAGKKHADQVARALQSKAASVRILQLPDLPPSGDVSNWFEAGGTPGELLELAAKTPEWEPPAADTENEVGEKKRQPSQAEILIQIAHAADFIYTPRGEFFAVVEDESRRELYPLRAKGFRRWLIRKFADRHDKPPGSQALQDAIGLLEARAEIHGKRAEVRVRVAGEDGKVYLDLGDKFWRAVEVSSDGWNVVPRPPVYFRRPRGMNALPIPEKGSSLELLRSFVNFSEEMDWILLVAWLVAALRPTGPYPVLVLQGEQGSGKSTVARMLKSLVDPAALQARSKPRNERDLMIAANNGWVLPFDNLSGLPSWLSDALCRLATGGGFGTRELYSDAGEMLFNATRPVMLNGIDDMISRGDLQDRALLVSLPPIPSEDRKSEREIWADFEEARPAILGALLDAVSTALRNLPQVTLETLPRMADFGEWLQAAEPALPWPRGTFMAAYDENRASAMERILEADSVATGILEMMDGRDEWVGTATELRHTLKEHVSEEIRRGQYWPKTPRVLSNRLNRATSFLRELGIIIKRERSASRRLIRINQKSSVSGVTPSQNASDGAQMDHAEITQDSPTSRQPHEKTAAGKGNDAGDADDAEMQTCSKRGLSPHQRTMLEEHELEDGKQLREGVVYREGQEEEPEKDR